jgi:hypothetical protein
MIGGETEKDMVHNGVTDNSRIHDLMGREAIACRHLFDDRIDCMDEFFLHSFDAGNRMINGISDT